MISNDFISQLIAIDQHSTSRLLYGEMIARVTDSQYERSRESWLVKLTETLLEDELSARKLLEFCATLRASGHLPDPLVEPKPVEISLDKPRDW